MCELRVLVQLAGQHQSPLSHPQQVSILVHHLFTKLAFSQLRELRVVLADVSSVQIFPLPAGEMWRPGSGDWAGDFQDDVNIYSLN